MPRIKQMLAEGGVVRMFGAGQLISPKLIEIVGEHGGFDALWLDGEHAGHHDEGDRARHDGRAGLRHGPLRPPAGHRLRGDHAPARGGGRGRDGQHGPLARRGRAGRALGQVLRRAASGG